MHFLIDQLSADPLSCLNGGNVERFGETITQRVMSSAASLLGGSRPGLPGLLELLAELGDPVIEFGGGEFFHGHTPLFS